MLTFSVPMAKLKEGSHSFFHFSNFHFVSIHHLPHVLWACMRKANQTELIAYAWASSHIFSSYLPLFTCPSSPQLTHFTQSLEHFIAIYLLIEVQASVLLSERRSVHLPFFALSVRQLGDVNGGGGVCVFALKKAKKIKAKKIPQRRNKKSNKQQRCWHNDNGTYVYWVV